MKYLNPFHYCLQTWCLNVYNLLILLVLNSSSKCYYSYKNSNIICFYTFLCERIANDRLIKIYKFTFYVLLMCHLCRINLAIHWDTLYLQIPHDTCKYQTMEDQPWCLRGARFQIKTIKFPSTQHFLKDKYHILALMLF